MFIAKTNRFVWEPNSSIHFVHYWLEKRKDMEMLLKPWLKRRNPNKSLSPHYYVAILQSSAAGILHE